MNEPSSHSSYIALSALLQLAHALQHRLKSTADEAHSGMPAAGSDHRQVLLS